MGATYEEGRAHVHRSFPERVVSGQAVDKAEKAAQDVVQLLVCVVDVMAHRVYLLQLLVECSHLLGQTHGVHRGCGALQLHVAHACADTLLPVSATPSSYIPTCVCAMAMAVPFRTRW